MEDGDFGSEHQRLTVADCCFCKFSLAQQCVAEVEMGLYTVGLDGQDSGEKFDSLLPVAQLQLDDAEAEEGIGVVGMDLQDLTKDPLSLKEIACLVGGDRGLKSVWQ